MTMSESYSKRESPPPQAYSRVTDPERFRPLHALGLALIDRLTAEYDVARTEEFVLLSDLQSFEHARPPVTLAPLVAEAAPVAIAFTRFPGLVVRYGLWQTDSFPSCGCDACAETATTEGERLEALLADVVRGHFREELVIPWFGRATLRWALGQLERGEGHHAEGGRFISRAEARALLRGRPQRVEWQPWRKLESHLAPAGVR